MSPEYIVSLLIIGGINLLSLAVGLGKSTLAEKLLQSPLIRDTFDFILYTAAQTQILNERVEALPPGQDTLILRPRPAKQCGLLNEEWSRLERMKCSGAARRTICPSCPTRGVCTWLTQFQGLDRFSTILGTQAYFRSTPLVLSKRLRDARKPLVVVDEDLILMGNFKRYLPRRELRWHIELLRASLDQAPLATSARKSVAAQLTATTALIDPKIHPADIETVPPLPQDVAAMIQQEGLDRFGDDFVYRGGDLFVCLASRSFRDARGVPGFIWRPWLAGATVLVLSAELHPVLVEHRLGKQVNNVFPARYTQHAGTRVYNIRDRAMSAKYLARHLASFSTPIAQFIIREMERGDRVVLVTRKSHLNSVVSTISRALVRLGKPRLQVIPYREMTGSADEIPVITYGLQGINALSDFRTVFCIGSYNVAPRALKEMLNDVHRPEEYLPVGIEYMGGTRTARVVGEERSPELDSLARRYLFQLEFNVANQAVGRVRHCTRPRKVIFCQQTELPYALEVPAFERFAGFCKHFGLDTKRGLQARERAVRVSGLRAKGLSQSKVAEITGLSMSTVKRRWRR